MQNKGTTQAVIVEQSSINTHKVVEDIAFFDANGDPLVLFAGDPADAVVTEFPVEAAAAIDDGDTIAEALAKLQAQIDALP
jgi:hypothetical protein